MKKTRAAAASLAVTAMLLGACSDNNVRDYRDTHTSRAPVSDETVDDEQTEEPTGETEEPTDETGEPTGETDEPTDDADGQTAEPEKLETDVEVTFSDQPATVTWETPGETFHVYTQGSSTAGCYAVPIEAWTDGERIEIDFEAADPGRACTMDMVTHAWSFTWDEPFDVEDEMTVELRGINLTGRVEIALPPEPGEPLA